MGLLEDARRTGFWLGAAGSDALDGLPDCLSLNCYPQVTDLARLDEGRLRLVIDTVESLRPSKTALAFKSFGALISPCVVYFVS